MIQTVFFGGHNVRTSKFVVFYSQPIVTNREILSQIKIYHSIAVMVSIRITRGKDTPVELISDMRYVRVIAR